VSLLSKIVGRAMRLPPATHAVRVERHLPIPMRDGVTLFAHRYFPVGVASPPLILARSPYGRTGAFGVLNGELLAERGLQALVVSVRGTFGSGGTLFPFHQEGEDGHDVIAWMRAQAWYPGAFATNGPSYLGLTQWAIAGEAGPELKAMCLPVTASEFRGQSYAGESFSLENALSWTDLIAHQEQPPLKFLWHLAHRPQLARGLMHLPLNEADRVGTGTTSEFYQQWLVHDALGDPWWKPAQHDRVVPAAAVQMHTGWFDLFLPWQLRDYARLKAAGHAPSLTIGPWAHAQPASLAAATRNAIPFLKAALANTPAPVTTRVYVTGQEQWRDLAEWPPPSTPTRWHLRADRKLTAGAPAACAPDTFTYDPANPTPSVGGPLLRGDTSGPRDNRKLEARSDVLVYTSEVLSEDLEIIGTPEADLFVGSSLEHTDFFARLCDVHPNGKSLNVCDALFRVKALPRETSGGWHLRFDLWPTAHRFLRGHRLRVQISSGAHPRYARNLGTGEPLATGTRTVKATQRVFHEPDRASAIVLPVTAP